MEKIPQLKPEKLTEKNREQLLNEIVDLKGRMLSMSPGPELSRLQGQVTAKEHQIEAIENKLWPDIKKRAA